VCFAWIFFRSDSLAHAISFIQYSLQNWWEHQVIEAKSILFYSFILLLFDWYLRRDERHLKVPKQRWLRYLIYLGLAFSILLKMDAEQSFIYFQF
jgi:hypothetical protein